MATYKGQTFNPDEKINGVPAMNVPGNIAYEWNIAGQPGSNPTPVSSPTPATSSTPAAGLSPNRLVGGVPAMNVPGTPEYKANIAGTLYSGGSSSSSGSTGGTDYESIARRALQLAQEANQPAVQSLQASIPEIGKGYTAKKTALESQITPLQDRYNALLDQIKGNQTTATNRQTVTTASELGRRGILPSSGLGGQTITSALEPLNTQYGGMIKDVGLGQNQDILNIQNQIAGLPTQQTAEERAVQNAISSLQSGAASSSVQTALSQYQLQQQAQQAEANRALQVQSLEQQTAQQQASLTASQAAQQREHDLANLIYQNVTLPTSKANISNINSQINNRNSDTGTTLTAEDFIKKFNAGNVSYSTTPPGTQPGVYNTKTGAYAPVSSYFGQ